MIERTLTESLRVFRYKPVARLDVDDPEQWKELADQRQHFVRNISAFRAPHEKGRFRKSDFSGIFEGEVAKVVEVAANYIERNAELLRLPGLRTVKVSEQELSNREGLELAKSACLEASSLGW